MPPDEVLSVTWVTLHRFSANVAAAEAPWAYLWTAVQNALVVETAAANLLSDQAVRRARCEWPIGVQRADDAVLDRAHCFSRLDGSPAEAADDEPSPAVATLVRYIADDDVTQIRFWTDAVERTLDVMADARRSYEETAVRRDPYLREELCLGTDELAALAALLIGPRRGDRAAHSLLLALHRDPTAQPADVTGAPGRLALLRLRRQRLTGERHDAA